MSQAWLGIPVILLLLCLASEDRAQIRWRLVLSGMGLQILLALTMLKVSFFNNIFLALNDITLAVDAATRAGTSMVFGYLGGGEMPFVASRPGATFVLAFRALPLVLVVSALSALLYYWRILPIVVKSFSWVLSRILGVGGEVGVAAAANIFVGMVEAPLMIKPYLYRLSRSELFMVMVCGMSTIAGTVLVLYAQILGSVIDNALAHILTASLISAPAALMVAHILVPEPVVVTDNSFKLPGSSAMGSLDAIVQGTGEGLKLLLNIVAMLIVFVAMVHLANQLLGSIPLAGSGLSLERLFGWLFAPLAWLIGVPWSEATAAGRLLGTKVVLNELLAYLDMSNASSAQLSSHSRLIITYALCGFANFGSLGIMIGGLSTMVPERRQEIVALGLKSILAGLLATCLTGAIAGLVLP